MELTAEQHLKNGDPHGALQALQTQVRAQPGNAKLRIFLFQLLAVLGQWERAFAQLNVAAQLDASALAMAQMYRQALRCEVVRNKVFQGELAPTVFGKPEQWLALLIEAQHHAAQGDWHHAEQLRQQAFEVAPTTVGTINGQAFNWIADADMRFGPVLEAIINDTYYWIPYTHLKKIKCDAPEDLRDMVWMPAYLTFSNDGETIALIPTRYPDTENCQDGNVLLARKTIWNEILPGLYCGMGQRVLSTDQDEIALLDVRELILG